MFKSLPCYDRLITMAVPKYHAKAFGEQIEFEYDESDVSSNGAIDVYLMRDLEICRLHSCIFQWILTVPMRANIYVLLQSHCILYHCGIQDVYNCVVQLMRDTRVKKYQLR